MQSTVPYTAQGHAGIVAASFVNQFWLDAGGQPTFENHVVAAGQILVAGSVLGVVTAASELVFSDPTAGDGSEEPFGILMEDVDTSATGLNASAELGILVSSNRMINFNALVYQANWDKKRLRIAMNRAGFTALRTPIHSAL